MNGAGLRAESLTSRVMRFLEGQAFDYTYAQNTYLVAECEAAALFLSSSRAFSSSAGRAREAAQLPGRPHRARPAGTGQGPPLLSRPAKPPLSQELGRCSVGSPRKPGTPSVRAPVAPVSVPPPVRARSGAGKVCGKCDVTVPNINARPFPLSLSLSLSCPLSLLLRRPS